MFQTLELDVSQAHDFFELLDTDGSNEVSLAEFMDGCMRLKGQARSVDVNMLILLNKKLSDTVSQVVDFVEAHDEDYALLREYLNEQSPSSQMKKEPSSPPAPTSPRQAA